jgi:trigger factor
MKVTVEALSPSKRALQIELPAERVAAAVQVALRGLSRKLQLPGFRRGKVPAELIQRRFQADLHDEVLRDLIPESYREALTQTDLKPIGEPKVDEVHLTTGAPLRFRAVVDIKPPIEVKDYRGIPVERAKVEVTDQEVERGLEFLREDAAEYVPMEGWPAMRDDLVILDHEGTVNGKPFKGGSGTNLAVVLGRGGYLPGFEDRIAGMQKGERKQFRLPFPDDYPRKDLAGKTVEFTVAVKEVKKRRVPELNDEFAKTVGDVESLAALREKVREQIQQRKVREQEADLKRAVLEKLAGAHEVDLPESLVALETASILQELAETVRAAGGRVRGLPGTPEELRAKAQETARRRVKEALLLEAVAHHEGMTVTDEELEREIQAVSSAYPAAGAANFRRVLNDPDRRADLSARLLARKALDFLFQQATVTEAYNLITPA